MPEILCFVARDLESVEIKYIYVCKYVATIYVGFVLIEFEVPCM